MNSKKKHLSTNKKTYYGVTKKIFAVHALTRGYCPKYTNSSCNSISKKQATQTKNVQMTFIDISPKKTYRWLTETQKDAQHH